MNRLPVRSFEIRLPLEHRIAKLRGARGDANKKRNKKIIVPDESNLRKMNRMNAHSNQTEQCRAGEDKEYNSSTIKT